MKYEQLELDLSCDCISTEYPFDAMMLQAGLPPTKVTVIAKYNNNYYIVDQQVRNTITRDIQVLRHIVHKQFIVKLQNKENV